MTFVVVSLAVFSGLAAAYFLQPWAVLTLAVFDIIFIISRYLKQKPDFLTISDKDVLLFSFGMIYLFFSTIFSMIFIFMYGIDSSSLDMFIR